MNNVKLLTQQLEEHPDDDICAYCLIDALIDEQDRTHEEARRIVELVRFNGRHGEAIAKATELLARGSRTDMMARRIMRRAMGSPRAFLDPIRVIPGVDGPHFTPGCVPQFAGWFPTLSVTVGADWLLREVAKHSAAREKINQARAARKRTR